MPWFLCHTLQRPVCAVRHLCLTPSKARVLLFRQETHLFLQLGGLHHSIPSKPPFTHVPHSWETEIEKKSGLCAVPPTPTNVILVRWSCQEATQSWK